MFTKIGVSLTQSRDQELRFTVHDSPDYYKLKCSVFNDDKKTDLIGESWVDLTEVIKIGGGQNDLWHQLSFKGKYAGDIRMELTFYDTREKPLEKKKVKERYDFASASDSTSDVSISGPRSLGPREIKRRPLPTNPTAPVTSTPPRARSITIENSRPELPPKIPIEEQPMHSQEPSQESQVIHAPIPTRPRGSSASPQPHEQPESKYYEEYERHSTQDQNDPYMYYQQTQLTQATHTQQSASQHPQQYQHKFQELSTPQRQPREQQYSSYDDSYMSNEQGYRTYSQPPQSSPYPDESELWPQQRPQSFHTHSAPITPFGSSPAPRPMPASTNSDSQVVRYQQQQRSDLDLTRQPYVDSPLRQSTSQQDMDLPPMSRPTVLPPLPPKHHDVASRRPRNEYPPSAYVAQPLRTSGNRASIPERSPLQSFEDDHLGYRQERFVDTQAPARHSMYEPANEQHYESPQQYAQSRQFEPQGRRRTYDDQPRFPNPHMAQPRQDPANHSRRNSFEPRHPTYNNQVTEEPQSMTPRDEYYSGHEDGYQPFVEDAPPSPGLQPAVARKAVGAQPKKLTGMPFGPDAYDVLNPASSPVSNVRTIFQTPDQAKEAERLREVEKIRELGPIIGNDGRVIDPSDHLPSDTWAPEPERKNRKPEHVIHIRTKNDPKRPQGARGSPMVVRHNGPQSVYSSPAPERDSSPATRTTPSSFAGGRNRLQKSTPTSARPLPNQPYGSPVGPTVSSPALASSPQNIHEDRRPSYDRRGSYDNRLSGHVNRPPLSDYQVPVGNSYTPRTGSYDRVAQKAIEPTYETPVKQPSYQAYSSPVAHERRGSYDPRRNSYDRRNSGHAYENGNNYDVSPSQPQQTRHYDDPLAAELSLIDIGPSRRGGQPTGYHTGALVKSRGRW